MKHVFKIRCLTPLFSHGAEPYQREDRKNNIAEKSGVPEIRPASIRGQLRWWMRGIGYGHHVDDVFGSAAGQQGSASKVVVRVDNIAGDTHKFKPLPHKDWSRRSGFQAGTEFDLILNERLGGLTDDRRSALLESVEAWLRMGALGYRATRGGGSLESVGCELNYVEWKRRCVELLNLSEWSLWLSSPFNLSEEKIREKITDTLGEGAFGGGQPLGGTSPRKTSPLRMRLVSLKGEEGFRIASVWVEPALDSFSEAVWILKNGRKVIGQILESSELIV